MLTRRYDIHKTNGDCGKTMRTEQRGGRLPMGVQLIKICVKNFIT